MSIEKYLDESKAERFLELLHHGNIYGPIETEDYKEFSTLIEESMTRQEELYGKPTHALFEGRCRRCGREFKTPIPEVTHPEGNHEIACVEWCADCNALTMSVAFRETSAYKTKKLFDPRTTKEKGGHLAN